MKTTNTFGIHFIVRKNKMINGKVPVYARVTVNGRISEISIKKKILLSNWNIGKGMAKSNSLENKKLNSYLEQIRAQLAGFYQELVLARKVITPEAIKNKFLGHDISDMTLIQLIDYHNKTMKKILEWGTLKNYFTTKKYIEEFLKHKFQAQDIYLSDLNYKFISDFEYYLRTSNPLELKRTMENNTVMKHLERLRKIVNMGLRFELITKDPFVSFKPKFTKADRGFLTGSELLLMEQKELDSGRLNYIRDLFIFSCYTGLAYSDVIQLDENNIRLGIDQEYWIFTKRKKTENIVNVPLLPKALELIEKYKNDPRSVEAGKIFPPISNQKINDSLKEIAPLCGINKNLTFHVARHTFATTVTLTKGVPIESVSKMLGHSKLSTTQIYARVIEQKISHDMKILKEKLQTTVEKNQAI